MTNPLAQARAEVAAALIAAGIPARDHEPSLVTPPVALVAPLGPYLTEARPAQYGRYQLRLRVRLVTATADANVATTALDEQLATAIPAIESIDRPGPEGWAVIEAGEPYTLVTGTAAFPAIDLTIQTTIAL